MDIFKALEKIVGKLNSKKQLEPISTLPYPYREVDKKDLSKITILRRFNMLGMLYKRRSDKVQD